MDPAYNHSKYESDVYALWEKSGAFKEKPLTGSTKPFTILMPPPNANASLHAGHAMYTVDDVLIRFRRMQGFSALWIPGLDHAGFETQYVYEKHLAKEGKSRMDFDRSTLYKNIYDFVKDNSGLIYEQFKRLGFSADWDRSVFTLDDNVTKQVFDTFKKMEREGLVYRDNYIVNYCVNCGTSLAELEVKHITRIDPLYFVKYKKANEDGYITVATTRPEPLFVDTHLAVNPADKKNKHLIGSKVINPLTGAEMEIIGDDFVDSEFGTGIVKLTPAHDSTDYEVAKRHKLPIISAIDRRGRIMANGGKYAGLKVKEARSQVVADLTEKGAIEKVNEDYEHSVLTCYKCGRDLEPMTTPNWFIKVSGLKKEVVRVVEKNEVKFHPSKFKSHMLNWLDIMHDWPISRQVAWGIQIPVWYEVSEDSDLEVSFIAKDGEKKFGSVHDFDFGEVKSGLQTVIAGPETKYVVSDKPPKGNYLPETDTFDTWFSSGQWPLVTLKENEFSSRYPTSVLGTLSDILKFWVSRMIMFSLYLNGEVPFENVYLWSMVADEKGVKMSKSKGNVVNPIELIDKYGADALRMSLLYGTPAGRKVVLSENKVKGMRNFANKVWNIARYVQDKKDLDAKLIKVPNKDDEWIIQELNETIKSVTKSLESFKLNEASETLYEFIWHKFADIYIEKTKDRKDEAQGTLDLILETSLKLLHPFMPFVTEKVWGLLDKQSLLIETSWPS